jgi:putative transposase
MLTPSGFKQNTTLEFMHIESRKMFVTRATKHPISEWMPRVAESFPMMAEQLGLKLPTILVRDYDVLYSREFNETLRREDMQPYPMSIHVPPTNAHIDRWMKSLKIECLDHFNPVGAEHLDYLVSEYGGQVTGVVLLW